MNRYITLDGYKYAVAPNTYIRRWIRQFTMSISAVTIQINFVDRGPGVRTYDMTLSVETWPTGSIVYKQTWDVQKTNLEASYSQISTPMAFVDPMGVSPTLGVYFTNLTERVTQASTVQTPLLAYEIELTAVGPEVP